MIIVAAALNPTAWAMLFLLAATTLRLLYVHPRTPLVPDTMSSGRDGHGPTGSTSAQGWASPLAWFATRLILATFVACSYLAAVSVPPSLWPDPRRPWVGWGSANWAPAVGQCPPAAINATYWSTHGQTIRQDEGISVAEQTAKGPSSTYPSGVICWLGISGDRQTAAAILAILAMTLCTLCRDFSIGPSGVDHLACLLPGTARRRWSREASQNRRPRGDGSQMSLASVALRGFLYSWPLARALPLAIMLATIVALAALEASMPMCLLAAICFHAMFWSLSALNISSTYFHFLRAVASLTLAALALFQSPFTPPQCRALPPSLYEDQPIGWCALVFWVFGLRRFDPSAGGVHQAPPGMLVLAILWALYDLVLSMRTAPRTQENEAAWLNEWHGTARYFASLRSAKARKLQALLERRQAKWAWLEADKFETICERLKTIEVSRMSCHSPPAALQRALPARGHGHGCGQTLTKHVRKNVQNDKFRAYVCNASRSGAHSDNFRILPLLPCPRRSYTMAQHKGWHSYPMRQPMRRNSTKRPQWPAASGQLRCACRSVNHISNEYKT